MNSRQGSYPYNLSYFISKNSGNTFFSQKYSGGKIVSTWNYLNEKFKLNPGDIDK